VRLAALCALMFLSCCESRPAKQPGGKPAAAGPAIVVRNLDTPGALVIENHGPTAMLRDRFAVESQHEGTWEDTGIDLELSGQRPRGQQETCEELRAGAGLRPARWSGWTCGGQFTQPCRQTAYIGPGTFRFVVSSCDGKHRWEGPPFELPAELPASGHAQQ